MAKADDKVTWSSLNKRQQNYLTAIYQADQEVEAQERATWTYGGRPRPAEQWRWMPYGSSLPSRLPMPVKKHLRWTEQINEGTGSTLEALEKRGLLEMQHVTVQTLRTRGILEEWQGIAEPEPIPLIRITQAGRKIVRQALGVRTSKHVTGTLQEWHWRALTRAYEAKASKGIPYELSSYGHIGWRTWQRLSDYTPAPLVQHYQEFRGTNTATGSPMTDTYLQITPFGIAFYERAYPRYHELYLDIAAPAPTDEHDPLEPFIEQVQGHRTCRACCGEYLVTITRTYRQRASWRWEVLEQDQRIPGYVKRTYGEYKQCACEEDDIVETTAPFLTLLDQLIAQGWQISFPLHHVYNYLDYLVGGLSIGNEKRWYDPELAKEKVSLLTSPETDIEDWRNIVKGEMTYCVNVLVGEGSIYPPGIQNVSSPHPVALTRAQKQEEI